MADVTATRVLTAATATAAAGVASSTSRLVIDASDASGFMVTVVGPFTGSVITEGSPDGGLNWVPTGWRQSVTGGSGNTLNSTRLVNNVAVLRGSAAGFTHYAVRALTLTAGTPTVVLTVHDGTAAIFTNTFIESRSLFQYYSSAAGGRVSFNAATDVVPAVGAANTPVLIGALVNPANSGQDIAIARLVLGSNSAGKFRRFSNGTVTIATGQTARTAVNRAGGTAIAKTSLYARETIAAETTTLTGGNLALVTFIPANGQVADAVDGTIMLRAGETMAWTFAPAAQSNNGECSIEAVWWETPQAPV